MAHYNYVAKDSAGKTVKGKEFAMSERELVMRLARKSLTIISIKRVEESDVLMRFMHRKKSLSVFDQMIFCRQLSTLLKGGVPLVKGLEIISSETENLTIQAAITEVSHYIRQGDSFSSSLKKMSHLFSPLFIAIIEAGEKVGALDTMLERLAKYLSAQDRLAKKIIAAISYPSAVLAFFLFAIGIMTLFLVPKFKSMYASFHATLPPFTLFVFGISDFLLRYIVYVVAGTVVLVLYINKIVFKSQRGRYLFDAFILKIPLFGPIMKKAALSKFTRTMATLLEQGIAVPLSLELVKKTAGNAVIEAASVKAAKSIMDGDKIPDAFRKTEIFPPLVIQMATIGTESGNLPELLDKTSDFFEEEVDVFLGIMSSLIEPVLIIVLGFILSIFIIALYLPIFKLSQAVGSGL
ncbi:MAG: type II secretion system F family protein [Candidatus Omnitrophica bacterium]|nr:type II secretion system F family protein [Candidatus Omnitrophota bacterium]